MAKERRFTTVPIRPKTLKKLRIIKARTEIDQVDLIDESVIFLEKKYKEKRAKV